MSLSLCANRLQASHATHRARRQDGLQRGGLAEWSGGGLTRSAVRTGGRPSASRALSVYSLRWIGSDRIASKETHAVVTSQPDTGFTRQRYRRNIVFQGPSLQLFGGRYSNRYHTIPHHPCTPSCLLHTCAALLTNGRHVQVFPLTFVPLDFFSERMLSYSIPFPNTQRSGQGAFSRGWNSSEKEHFPFPSQSSPFSATYLFSLLADSCGLRKPARARLGERYHCHPGARGCQGPADLVLPGAEVLPVAQWVASFFLGERVPLQSQETKKGCPFFPDPLGM